MVDAKEKQGFLTPELQGRFKEGDRVPFLEELGIPSRIGKQGEAEWALIDRSIAQADFFSPYVDYRIEKDERVRHAIFKMWHLFMQALLGEPLSLMGQPVGSIPHNEDLVITIPGEPSPTYWTVAPKAVQSAAFYSA